MLLLSYKIPERLLLDGDILISVLGICGNRVRLGIEAPDRVSAVCEELTPPVEAEGHTPGWRSPARC
jgi:carbon storage regulator